MATASLQLLTASASDERSSLHPTSLGKTVTSSTVSWRSSDLIQIIESLNRYHAAKW